MDTLAINASQQEIDLMITEIDKNNDGEIQFEGAQRQPPASERTSAAFTC